MKSNWDQSPEIAADGERLELLLNRYFDQALSRDEKAELERMLLQSSAAQATFWSRARWHAALREWGQQALGREAALLERHEILAPPAQQSTARPVAPARLAAAGAGKIVRFPLARWAVGIAAAAAVIMVLLTIQSPAPVASLERVAGGVWKSRTREPGDRLTPGRFQLEKGAIVIAFDRGARLVIEGPADFDVRGNNAMTLRTGRLRAHVPPLAHGFEVVTPQFTAVDLGTEFGCDVALNGTGELHVFAGTVAFHSGSNRDAAVALNESQAIRMERGLVTTLRAQPHSFLSETELTQRELRENGEPLIAWRMASRQLDENPTTVLHLDFENVSGGMVPNRAQQAPAGTGAKIIGCEPAEGRWPGKGALAFQGAEDRLEFTVLGQFKSLTLIAWVRVRAVHDGQNSLLMGRVPQPGAVHWYLYGDGGLGIGVQSNKEPADWNTFHSGRVVGRHHLDSWIFLANVLDGATGTATHYFDGELIARRAGIARVPLQLAGANIGNHVSEFRKPGEPPANFDGTIDELAVLATALTSEDIAQLYRQGKPGPQ